MREISPCGKKQLLTSGFPPEQGKAGGDSIFAALIRVFDLDCRYRMRFDRDMRGAACDGLENEDRRGDHQRRDHGRPSAIAIQTAASLLTVKHTTAPASARERDGKRSAQISGFRPISGLANMAHKIAAAMRSSDAARKIIPSGRVRRRAGARFRRVPSARRG